jgi:hypothetical protein
MPNNVKPIKMPLMWYLLNDDELAKEWISNNDISRSIK